MSIKQRLPLDFGVGKMTLPHIRIITSPLGRQGGAFPAIFITFTF